MGKPVREKEHLSKGFYYYTLVSYRLRAFCYMRNSPSRFSASPGFHELNMK